MGIMAVQWGSVLAILAFQMFCCYDCLLLYLHMKLQQLGACWRQTRSSGIGFKYSSMAVWGSFIHAIHC